MRAPAVTPSDEEVRPSGTMQTPTSATLEAMMQETRREEQLAAARSIPTNRVVELPDAETTSFVPAPKSLMNTVVAREVRDNASEVRDNASKDAIYESAAPSTRRRYATDINTSGPLAPETSVVPGASLVPARSAAELRLVPESREMRVGERRQLRLLLKTDAPLGLVSFSLRFDPRVLAVRSFVHGPLFARASDGALTQTVTPEGFALISVAPAAGVPPLTGAGVLLLIEVEALAAGADALTLNAEDVHVVAADGRRVLLKITSGQISVAR